MANLKASIKDIKKISKRNFRNRVIKSNLKTTIKKFNNLLVENQIIEAKDFYKIVVKTLDKAVTKGTIHKNTASRKKSKLSFKLNKVLA